MLALQMLTKDFLIRVKFERRYSELNYVNNL